MKEKDFEENGTKRCIIKGPTPPNVRTHECHWPLQISGAKQIRLQYSKEKGGSLLCQQAACITERHLERELYIQISSYIFIIYYVSVQNWDRFRMLLNG